MLTPVVNGLRAVRAPLVAGSLWFAALWLALGPERLVPEDEADASTFERRLSSLLDAVGPTTTLAAVALAAVLLGDLIPTPGFRMTGWLWLKGVTGVTDALDRWGNDQRPYLGRHIPWTDFFSEEAPARLQQAIAKVTEDAEDESDDDFDPKDLSDSAVVEVQKGVLQVAATRELDLLHSQLEVGSEGPRDEFRRVDAEADLRLSLIAPSAAIALIACLTWSWWCLVLFAVPCAFAYDGANRQRRLTIMIFTALRFGHVTSPTAEYVKRLSERYRQEPIPPTVEADVLVEGS